MPELPEVETVMRGLKPVLEGRRLIEVEQRRADLRWPIPSSLRKNLLGKRVLQLERRAKFILWHLDSRAVVILHLGMSGNMLVSDKRPRTLHKHDHLVFTTDDGITIRYNDPRRFGSIDLTWIDKLADHKMIKRLGPEPMSNQFNSAVLSAGLRGRTSPIKSVLLDQTVVAGLGNIYACEALYRSGISPKRLASNTRGKKLDRLVSAIRDVLRDAIQVGGSSLRDHVQTSGEIGYFQNQFKVYGREGECCPNDECRGKIRRIVQAGRATFYCAACQR
ncbi:MAG: DNA-formamidopyrimidine glycosylase [Rhodospirillaceae bacterium]|nr:DNA-formamidopyrimidine glycosylase [Rhodospirillaceae bacterium]